MLCQLESCIHNSNNSGSSFSSSDTDSEYGVSEPRLAVVVDHRYGNSTNDELKISRDCIKLKEKPPARRTRFGDPDAVFRDMVSSLRDPLMMGGVSVQFAFDSMTISSSGSLTQYNGSSDASHVGNSDSEERNLTAVSTMSENNDEEGMITVHKNAPVVEGVGKDDENNNWSSRIKFNELIRCDCHTKGLEPSNKHLCQSLRCRLLWLKNKLGWYYNETRRGVARFVSAALAVRLK